MTEESLVYTLTPTISLKGEGGKEKIFSTRTTPLTGGVWEITYEN